MPLILPSLFVNSSCKITKNPTLVPVDFKTHDFDTGWHDLHVLSQYRSEKDGENIGIIVENKLINGLEINLECVQITFNHKCSGFNICCGPRMILLPSASCLALILTEGRNKRSTPQTRD